MSDPIKSAPTGARVRIVKSALIHGVGYREVPAGSELTVEEPGDRTQVERRGMHFAIPGSTPFELVSA
jgi:hypothetical protein